MVIVVGKECLAENHAIPPRGHDAITSVKMTLSLEIGADTHCLFLLVINQCVQGLDTKNRWKKLKIPSWLWPFEKSSRVPGATFTLNLEAIQLGQSPLILKVVLKVAATHLDDIST
ncbi:hypothetical protein VNO77_03226 [Canavalia gladiata]|uniref:Uncharacterized protein n=1 Tax=Canavalia gladiata TaxID=3824 RepID=A0AAN9MUC7_CANGL